MHLISPYKDNKNKAAICLVTLIGIFFAIQIACKKEIPEEIPSLVTINVTSITGTSFLSGGLVFSAGGASVQSRGICWSTNKNPSISDIKTIDGIGTGSFTSTISGLDVGTTYYVRAYATNSIGTGYGNQYVVSTTIVLPSLTTTSISSITTTTAISGGTVTSDGGSEVTGRGVCWSTTPGPIIANNITSDGTGIGNFSSEITGMTPGITYYVRAYATNSIGTSYGNQYEVNTLSGLPSIATTSISSITTTTAFSGSSITSDGGSEVTGRGVCWSTTTGPTIANSITSDGTGIGTFSSELTALTPGITYYVRAYATNSSGTYYGNELTFNTECNIPAAPGAITGNTNIASNATNVAYSISAVSDATSYTWTVPAGAIIASGQGTTGIMVDFGSTGGDVSVRSENGCGNSTFTNLNITTAISNCGTIMDTDGNVYNTVTIGSQCWMSENLKTTKYNNGDPILTETDHVVWSTLTTGAYCWYNNDAAAYQATYGALYNWYSVDDSRNLCPTGWHVPTNAEWTILEDFLVTNGYNYDGSIIANKCAKALASSTGWNSSSIEGTVGNTDYSAKRNVTGFTALPGGVRDANQLIFGSIGNYAMWWTASEDSPATAWDRGLANSTNSLGRLNVLKSHGFSVRCLKDN
jgi:uncharacterized protein (TIGR02145 family)